MALLRDSRDHLESSYLLSHVDNPVAWWSWGADALAEASRRDVPIFLSVGYASCHWCHVMAHESFEDDEIAATLNSNFLPVKVDREERPDVDALYMAATQLVSGHGGWPMSVFLLPDGRPFMAGTYYPPSDRAGHVGFPQLLEVISRTWRTRREDVERQAEDLSRALERDVHFIDYLTPSSRALNLDEVRAKLRDELVSSASPTGGFGDAPMFPRPTLVTALVEFNDAAAHDGVTRTLDAMSREGLYDHLDGGFARYAVDGAWHVPHFEKMLSDQALLAKCYLNAGRSIGREEWRAVGYATFDFVERALGVGGQYASSLDADADGVEGAHVTWTDAQVFEALRGAQLDQWRSRVLQRWRIESPGAFEGRSIPRLATGEPFETPPELVPAARFMARQRASRTQPPRDEKVVLEWNAYYASALLTSLESRHVTRALELLRSLRLTHGPNGVWWRTRSRAHASASDVAALLNAEIDAYEVTGDDDWLLHGGDLARYLLRHYWDGPVPTSSDPGTGGGFFAQSDLVDDVPIRPKEVFDGATPSAHALATRALARLARVSGETALMIVAERLVELARPLITNHPVAVADLVEAAGFVFDAVEVVIPGEPGPLAHHVRSMSMPRTLLITGSGSSPLLREREMGLAYVCRGGVCRLPVSNRADLDVEVRRAVGA